MPDHRWRIFHADGTPPPADVTALLGRSGVWPRAGDDLWVCPGGTTYLAWADMPPEWGPWVECPDYRVMVDADEQAKAPPRATIEGAVRTVGQAMRRAMP